MAGGDSLWYQKTYGRMNGHQVFGTTGVSGAVVLSGATGAASGAIFIQTINVLVTTGSAATWQFQDSSGNSVTAPIDMTTANVPFHFDFGAQGVQLATGASLVVSGSASGAGASVDWTGFRQYMGGTSVLTTSPSGASGNTP